ncbi:hypothetical protein AAE478_004489 [Parahypoxylon ruwenzoriense]
MRLSVVLILAALAGVVHAGWLRWSADREQGLADWVPRETGAIAAHDQAGWTPKPTAAAGAAKPENERVLDLLQRQETTEWVNEKTCGWVSGSSSFPFTCAGEATCATNSRHVVACVEETYSPFYSLCLDYAAYQSGSCHNVGTHTGCCTVTDYPACGTYLWAGEPVRSMFLCFSTETVISMQDEPQFVIDASLSSAAAAASASASATATSATSATVSSNDPAPIAPGPGPDPTDGISPSNNDESSTGNKWITIGIPCIVSGCVGIWIVVSIIQKIREKRRQERRARADSPGAAVPRYRLSGNYHNVYSWGNIPLTPLAPLTPRMHHDHRHHHHARAHSHTHRHSAYASDRRTTGTVSPLTSIPPYSATTVSPLTSPALPNDTAHAANVNNPATDPLPPSPPYSETPRTGRPPPHAYYRMYPAVDPSAVDDVQPPRYSFHAAEDSRPETAPGRPRANATANARQLAELLHHRQQSVDDTAEAAQNAPVELQAMAPQQQQERGESSGGEKPVAATAAVERPEELK